MKHPKACECEPCVKDRVRAYLDRITDTSRLVPEALDQTVAVRAHWRRHPGHLKKLPKTRSLLREQLSVLMKKGKS